MPLPIGGLNSLIHSIAQVKRFRKECEPHPLTWWESLAGSQFDSEVVFGTRHSDTGTEPKSAAALYVEQLGFKITDDNPKMIALHGDHINLFSEPGPPLGPVLEVTMDDVEEAKRRLLENGCEIVKNEPDSPRTYV